VEREKDAENTLICDRLPFKLRVGKKKAHTFPAPPPLLMHQSHYVHTCIHPFTSIHSFLPVAPARPKTTSSWRKESASEEVRAMVSRTCRRDGV
jgi:hypothetical protein